MNDKDVKQAVQDIRYLISTDCCDETIQKRVMNFLELKQSEDVVLDGVSIPSDGKCYKDLVCAKKTAGICDLGKCQNVC